MRWINLVMKLRWVGMLVFVLLAGCSNTRLPVQRSIYAQPVDDPCVSQNVAPEAIALGNAVLDCKIAMQELGKPAGSIHTSCINLAIVTNEISISPKTAPHLNIILERYPDLAGTPERYNRLSYCRDEQKLLLQGKEAAFLISIMKAHAM